MQVRGVSDLSSPHEATAILMVMVHVNSFVNCTALVSEFSNFLQNHCATSLHWSHSIGCRAPFCFNIFSQCGRRSCSRVIVLLSNLRVRPSELESRFGAVADWIPFDTNDKSRTSYGSSYGSHRSVPLDSLWYKREVHDIVRVVVRVIVRVPPSGVQVPCAHACHLLWHFNAFDQSARHHMMVPMILCTCIATSVTCFWAIDQCVRLRDLYLTICQFFRHMTSLSHVFGRLTSLWGHVSLANEKSATDFEAIDSSATCFERLTSLWRVLSGWLVWEQQIFERMTSLRQIFERSTSLRQILKRLTSLWTTDFWAIDKSATDFEAIDKSARNLDFWVIDQSERIIDLWAFDQSATCFGRLTRLWGHVSLANDKSATDLWMILIDKSATWAIDESGRSWDFEQMTILRQILERLTSLRDI